MFLIYNIFFGRGVWINYWISEKPIILSSPYLLCLVAVVAVVRNYIRPSQLVATMMFDKNCCIKAYTVLCFNFWYSYTRHVHSLSVLLQPKAFGSLHPYLWATSHWCWYQRVRQYRTFGFVGCWNQFYCVISVPSMIWWAATGKSALIRWSLPSDEAW